VRSEVKFLEESKLQLKNDETERSPLWPPPVALVPSLALAACGGGSGFAVSVDAVENPFFQSSALPMSVVDWSSGRAETEAARKEFFKRSAALGLAGIDSPAVAEITQVNSKSKYVELATPAIDDGLLLKAGDVMSSSRWTGRKTVREQIQTIKFCAPLAISALSTLESALSEHRPNDPETIDALTALKQLHAALDELICAAERKGSLVRLWKKFEANKEKFFESATASAKILAIAPTAAVATTTVLCWLSGFTMTPEMLATVYGSGVIGEQLKKS
jgi:hypothetical protein